MGLQSAFGFPLVRGDDVLGVMEFFSREIRQPDEDLLAMLTAAGDWVAGLLLQLRGETLHLGWFGSTTVPPRAGASEVLDGEVDRLDRVFVREPASQ